MNQTRICLTSLLALAAFAACGGDRATAPDKTGVRSTDGTLAHDEGEEPPVQPDGEYTRPDGTVYCILNGLGINGPCPVASELVLTCPANAVRGTRVECTVRATENRPFRIDSAVAFPAGGPPIRVRDTPATFGAGAADTVSGELIVRTVLTVWGDPLGPSFLRSGATSGVSFQMQVPRRPLGSRR